MKGRQAAGTAQGGGPKGRVRGDQLLYGQKEVLQF